MVRNWGSHLLIHSLTPTNSDEIAIVHDENQKPYRGMYVSVENKSRKHIEGIEIWLSFSGKANNSTETEEQDSGNVKLRFTDGTNFLNGRTRKNVFVAYQKIEDHEFSLGEPGYLNRGIVAGMFYRCILEVSGKNTRTKSINFLMECMQYTDPVFRLRFINSDSQHEDNR